LIPETVSKERPEQGKVVAVGEGRWNEDGDARVKMSVKIGDTVLFSKYGPDEVKIDGEEYYVLREDSILAVIKNK
jgi:chaperonin GroES